MHVLKLHKGGGGVGASHKCGKGTFICNVFNLYIIDFF